MKYINHISVPHIFVLGIPNPVDFSLVPDASPPMSPLPTSVNGMSGTGFFYYRGGILTCGGKLNNEGNPHDTCHFHSMSGLDAEPLPDLPQPNWGSGNLLMDGSKPWMVGGSANGVGNIKASTQ